MRKRDQQLRIQRQRSLQQDQAAAAYRTITDCLDRAYEHRLIDKSVGVNKDQHVPSRYFGPGVAGGGHLAKMDHEHDRPMFACDSAGAIGGPGLE